MFWVGRMALYSSFRNSIRLFCHLLLASIVFSTFIEFAHAEEDPGRLAKEIGCIRMISEIGGSSLDPLEKAEFQKRRRHFYLGLTKSVLLAGTFIGGYTYGLSKIQSPMVAAFAGLIGGYITNSMLWPILAQFLPHLSSYISGSYLPPERDKALKTSGRQLNLLLGLIYLHRSFLNSNSLSARTDLMLYLTLADASRARVREFIREGQRSYAAIEMAEFLIASRHPYRDLLNEETQSSLGEKLSRVFPRGFNTAQFSAEVFAEIHRRDLYWAQDPELSKAAYIKMLQNWGLPTKSLTESQSANVEASPDAR